MATKTVTVTSTSDSNTTYKAQATDSCGNKAAGTWTGTKCTGCAKFVTSTTNDYAVVTIYPADATAGTNNTYTITWSCADKVSTTYTIDVVTNIKNASKVSMVSIQNNFPGSWYWVDEKGTSHSIFAGSIGNTTGVASVSSDATITLNVVLSATNANAASGGPYSKCNSCYAAITISGSNLQVSNPSGNWAIAGDLSGATSVEFTTSTNLAWDSLVGNLSGSISVDNGDYTLTVKWQLVNS